MSTRPRLGRAALAAVAVVLAGGTIFAGPAGADQPTAPSGGGSAPVTLVVGRGAELTTAGVAAALAGLSPGSPTTLARLSATTITVPASEVGAALDRLAPVASYVHPALTYHATDFAPADPEFGLQAELSQIDAPGAWARTTGSGVVVAVVDTGIIDGPDLSDGGGTSLVAGYDEVDQDSDPTDVSSGSPDWSSHGTLVASTLAARSNGFGIVGACPGCRIMPVRALGPDGSGSEIAIAEGIDWATTHGASVINLSLGGDPSSLIAAAVDRAERAGVVVVAAAGNDGDSVALDQATPPEYPAAIPTVLSVASTCSHTGIVDDPDPTAPCAGASDGRLATFTGRGGWVDVAAPGVTLATQGSDTYLFSGTSASTPFVSGVAALVRAAHPTWTPAEVRAAVEQTAAPITPAGLVAAGEVRAGAAVATHLQPAGSVDAPGTYLTGAVTTTVHTSADVTVSSVALLADGRPVANLTPSGPGAWSGTWDSDAVPDGAASLAAVLTDADGDSSTTAATAAVVDNQPPSLHLYGPRFGTVEHKAFGVFAVSGDGGSGVRLTLVAEGSSVAGGSTGPVTIAEIPLRRSGPLVIRAAAVDRAGHISFSNAIVVVARPRRR